MAKNKNDIILELLLQTQGYREDGIPITLFVHGTVITGKAVPTSRYVRHMVTGVEGTDSVWDDLAATFKEGEDNFTRLNEQDYDSLAPDEQKIVDAPRGFINLIEAKFQGADGRLLPSGQLVAFRVKIASVDGWVYGDLRVSEG